LRAHVIHHALVAALQKALHHIGTHSSQSNHANLHLPPLSSRTRSCPGLSESAGEAIALRHSILNPFAAIFDPLPPRLMTFDALMATLSCGTGWTSIPLLKQARRFGIKKEDHLSIMRLN
jgi:hypothetical protein